MGKVCCVPPDGIDHMGDGLTDVPRELACLDGPIERNDGLERGATGGGAVEQIARVKAKRVLALVKAFLKAGILTELGESKDTHTGTPQGGVLSPLLANVALAVLDEHLHRSTLRLRAEAGGSRRPAPADPSDVIGRRGNRHRNLLSAATTVNAL